MYSYHNSSLIPVFCVWFDAKICFSFYILLKETKIDEFQLK